MKSKQHISNLATILKQKGVEQIVISPGSRNAPLIQAFIRDFPSHCTSIVDERSAAYFALGMAVKSGKPIVIITTSGTAVLNLAPAIAEAHYQGIPLLVITADRPAEWIDQQDNQSIKQNNIFNNNCKSSFELPVESATEDDLWRSNRIINEGYNIAISGKKGPVHINVPLREPLYNTLPIADNYNIIDIKPNALSVLDKDILNKWNNAKGIFIVCGQHELNQKLQDNIASLAVDSRVVVLSESISNIWGENVLQNPEIMFQRINSDSNVMKPDLILYFGGQVVSKATKDYLRGLSKSDFWYISPSSEHIDTFKSLTTVIQSEASETLGVINDLTELNIDSNFKESWKLLYHSSKSIQKEKLNKLPFSDLWVFNKLNQCYAQNDILFAGNSSVIRYMQLFTNCNTVFSNRGTSGIDGCVSTASGIANMSHDKVLAIVGDLSFLYDSNGLWNRELPANLKIIVINNKGGNIFDMINGPEEQVGVQEYLEAHHPVSLELLAKAYSVKYFRCEAAEEFNKSYQLFYSSNNTSILEIVTSSKVNTTVFRTFIKNCKNNE